MRLRLYHHPDGARVAYRELGAGPPLALLHSAMLSHKEWEPAVEQLDDRVMDRQADAGGEHDDQHGQDRDDVLTQLVNVLSTREMLSAKGA